MPAAVARRGLTWQALVVDAFTGRMPLWKALCLWYVMVPLTVYGAMLGFLWFSAHTDLYVIRRLGLLMAALLVLGWLTLAVVTYVALRCAGNASWRWLAWLVRVLVIVDLAVAAIKMLPFVPYALRYDGPLD